MKVLYCDCCKRKIGDYEQVYSIDTSLQLLYFFEP